MADALKGMLTFFNGVPVERVDVSKVDFFLGTLPDRAGVWVRETSGVTANMEIARVDGYSSYRQDSYGI